MANRQPPRRKTLQVYMTGEERTTQYWHQLAIAGKITGNNGMLAPEKIIGKYILEESIFFVVPFITGNHSHDKNYERSDLLYTHQRFGRVILSHKSHYKLIKCA